MENSINKQLRTKEHEDIERDLNLKIMQITTEIRDHYPELIKFLDEMPVTIPDEKDMDITLKSLKYYYDSLNSILNNYITEQA
jgi:hypothetical protein